MSGAKEVTLLIRVWEEKSSISEGREQEEPGSEAGGG